MSSFTKTTITSVQLKILIPHRARRLVIAVAIAVMIGNVDCQGEEQGPAFVTVGLRNGVEIELPATWQVAGKSTLAEMRNAAHAKIDLSNLAVPNLGEYESLLIAGRVTEDSFATVTVTYKSKGRPTQDTIRNWSEDDISIWAKTSQAELSKIAPMTPGYSWQGATREEIAGRWFLKSAYERTHEATGETMTVFIWNYFDGATVQISTSFFKKDALLWRPILSRIVSSLTLKPSSPN